MAKPPSVHSAAEVAQMFELDLKNRALAALLAWLLPGAGHLYQGRTAKGLLLMICITTTFVFGFYLGNGKVAYATPLTMDQIAANGGGNYFRNRLTQAIDRWPFLCQAGIGAVAVPAVIERQRFLSDKQPLFGGWFWPPKQSGRDVEPTIDSVGGEVQHPNELAKWNYEMGFYFELGTIYTVVAGLLNILAIYDAHSGPLITATPARKDNDSAGGDASKSGDKEAG
ncbi:MAG: DUF6677 family protein [Planctomycetota bacterium]